MNKFQFSETVNIAKSIMNCSNNSDNLVSLSQPNYNNINSKLIHEKSPLETPLSTKGNVKSFCRIRPNNTMYSSLSRFKPENNNKTLIVDFTLDQDKNNPSKQFLYKYNFTEIFWTSVSNQEIFEKVCKPSIQELFSMHKNALIFVYGITNSGKTYTVNGNMNTPGILQLSLISLFKEYKKLKENNNSWLLNCTYIEIYNEEVFDLLSKDRKKVRIVGGGNKFYSQGSIIKTIDSFQDFKDALSTGENNRTKAETNANPYSSRSHSIFRVELSYQDKDGFNFIEPVSLCIVDLAGAERVSKSGVMGSNLKEAGNINSSLLVLKKCFDAMEANSRTNLVDKKLIVPVRESKLTMLFKEYFAAHQNISVICTINPDKNEMMDIRSVLNFGAKAMKVKPVKSWIPTINYSSKEVSPNKSGSRGNSPLVKENRKKYKLLTEKKYLDKKYNYSKYHLHNNSSKENICKVKEDNYSNNSSKDNSSRRKNEIISGEKIHNIKLLKHKGHEIGNSQNILTIHDENSLDNKITNKMYQERIKCYNNPFELVASKTNNFFMKNSPSKEKLKLEKEIKEKREKEIKEKLSKHKEDIKNLVLNIFNKKMYYDNLEKNIDIYEKQCKNIDLNEVEALLCNNNENNVYSLKNPFINNYEEDKYINLSKAHTINLSFMNVIKEKILKNENNINISYKPSKKNPNYEIISNYNIDYIPEKINNNEFDIFRGNKELIEELQLKLNNSDHDQTKIMEFLDKSFEQYNASQFKAYFGIGNTLIKRMNEKPNKEKEINDEQESKKDIEMIDKIDKAENDKNINISMNDNIIDFFSDEYNFKGKGKGDNIIKLESKENKRIEIKEEDKNRELIEEEVIQNEKKTKEKKSKKGKKPKKKGKKKKYESDSDEDNKKELDNEEIKESDKEEEKEEKKEDKKEETIEEEEEDKNEKKPGKKKRNISKKRNKSKKNKSKKRRKPSYNEESYNNEEDNVDNKNNDEIDEKKVDEEEEIIIRKKSKKKRKNKKKKIESDIDSIDELSEENENIKPIRKKKGRSKNNRK